MHMCISTLIIQEFAVESKTNLEHYTNHNEICFKTIIKTDPYAVNCRFNAI